MDLYLTPLEGRAPKRTDRELIEESLTLLRAISTGEDETHFGRTINVETPLWSSIERLKLHFEWVKTGGVPPVDLRPDVEDLVNKARRLRSTIQSSSGGIPLWLDVLWRELMHLRAKIENYTAQEEKRYPESDSMPTGEV